MMRSILMNSIRLLLIIMLSLALIGCQQAEDDTSDSKNTGSLNADQSKTKDWKLVKSEDKKLSLKVPQDWSVQTDDDIRLGPGKLFAVFGPEEGGYRTNIQISKETASRESLSSYINQFEVNSRKDEAIKDLKVREEGKVNVPFGEGYRKLYDFTLATDEEKMDLIFDALYVKVDDDFYVIQLVSTKNRSKRLEDVFENVLGTLNIK